MLAGHATAGGVEGRQPELAGGGGHRCVSGLSGEALDGGGGHRCVLGLSGEALGCILLDLLGDGLVEPCILELRVEDGHPGILDQAGVWGLASRDLALGGLDLLNRPL